MNIRLVCVTFCGAHVTEGYFESISAAWDRSIDMGSRWYFYPFHFVLKDLIGVSGDSVVVSAPDCLKHYEGRDFREVQEVFKTLAAEPANAKATVEEFTFELAAVSFET